MPRATGSLKTKGKKIKDTDKKFKNNLIEKFNEDELIFALDIGTRTVVGVVGIEEQQKLRVLAVDILEHKSRAMIDGQVHDIEQVAAIAGMVKARLEDKLKVRLTKVAIAAAGRVLKTCEVMVERQMEHPVNIDRALVANMEMEAIQKSQLKLEENVSPDERSQFFCVGYSVITYYLNGFAINSLEGHHGSKIGAKVLATFLPQIVVDSLYTVMSKVGLDVVSLTLEPIAAINVTIPKDLRMLNLALVDIGAGTSDIALTREGSVIAYGMVPIAGDEITEKIAENYLVDFNTAEKIKMVMTSSKPSIEFMDILGKKQSAKLQDIQKIIEPVVQIMAETISEKILEFNGKTPNAVFLIGGGSRVPGLDKIIADKLNLPQERVAVRGRDVIQSIKTNDRKLMGPESITPYGIAVTALIQRGQDFLVVNVNDKKVRILNSRKITAIDSLILSGYSAERLIGRSGKSIRFEINGSKRTLKGEYGKPAEIYINGSLSSIEASLKMGDDIKVIPAVNGADAALKVSDIIKPEMNCKVYLNGASQIIGTKVYINNTEHDTDCSITDGDAIKTISVKTLKDFIVHNEIDTEYFEVLINGQYMDMNYVLQDGDDIKCTARINSNDEAAVAAEASATETETTKYTDTLSGDDLLSRKEDMLIAQISDIPRGSILITFNGKETLINGGKDNYIFVDIFNFIDFDISKPQGTIILMLNGKQAAFTDIIKSGDAIDVYWEK